MKQAAGKSVWIISADQGVPFDSVQAQGAAQAASLAGIKINIYDGQGTVSQQDAGVRQAVAAGADGIILLGVDPEKVSSSMKAVKAKGIPVVDTFNGDYTAPLTTGLVAHVTSNYRLDGKHMADWVLADTKCQANTVLFNIPVYAAGNATTSPFKQEYARLCKSCKFRQIDIQLTSSSSELYSQTRQALTRDPSITSFAVVFDFMATSVSAALAQAKRTNSQVKANLIGHDGLPENLKMIRDGKQAADVVTPSLAYNGWTAMDQMARAVLKLPVKGVGITGQIVDKNTLPNNDSALLPSYKNYQQDYKKLWNLS